MRKLLLSATFLTALIAGPALAGPADVQVQVEQRTPTVAVNNTSAVIVADKLTASAAAVGTNIAVDANGNAILRGVGWASDLTGVVSQHVTDTTQDATVNVNLTSPEKLDVSAQAIGAAADVSATGHVTIAGDFNQRAVNTDSRATANVSNSLVRGASKIGSTAVGVNLTGEGYSATVLDGANVATQNVRGSNQTARTNVGDILSFGKLDVDATAISANIGFETAGPGSYTVQQSFNPGATWAGRDGASSAFAVANLSDVLSTGNTSVNSTAVNANVSLEGASVDARIGQSVNFADATAITNVSRGAFGANLSTGATAIGSNISVTTK